jgi:hypothetical protein
MQILIRTVSSQFLVLTVSADTTVLQLKQAIEVRNGTLVRMQALLYGAKPLIDERTLGDYGIIDNSTVQLTLRLLGGC